MNAPRHYCRRYYGVRGTISRSPPALGVRRGFSAPVVPPSSREKEPGFEALVETGTYTVLSLPVSTVIYHSVTPFPLKIRERRQCPFYSETAACVISFSALLLADAATTGWFFSSFWRNLRDD